MPVRFACPYCQKMLGIGRRKIGADVDCPRCGMPIRVPDQQEAARSIEEAHQERLHQRATVPHPELMVYEDIAELLPPHSSPAPPGAAYAPPYMPPPPPAPTHVRAPAPPAPAPHPPAQKYGDAPAPRSSLGTSPAAPGWGGAMPGGSDVDNGWLLISRRAVFMQGAVLLGAVIASFTLGFVSGRVAGPASADRTDGAGLPSVSLRGTAVFRSGGGRTTADFGALVMALPVDKPPDQPIDPKGLAPGNLSAAARAINDWGGDCVLADNSGSFELVLPKPGKYVVLIVSANQPRAANTQVPSNDRDTLARYFTNATALLGSADYSLDHLDLAPGAPALERAFGE